MLSLEVSECNFETKFKSHRKFLQKYDDYNT